MAFVRSAATSHQPIVPPPSPLARPPTNWPRRPVCPSLRGSLTCGVSPPGGSSSSDRRYGWRGAKPAQSERSQYWIGTTRNSNERKHSYERLKIEFDRGKRRQDTGRGEIHLWGISIPARSEASPAHPR